ncbi:hypothetical protein FVE67_06065 [Thermosulfurimonas marina]|uniref:Doubled CXXCH motif domain-containing protein n=1 Tax=Thermosulfurimonas marina TaxID=2047767 RepID=A0A6H1WTE5_9BACT|nr:cytochrome c3 family protein [Thermosulfurimonas marina]QJA06396.1 hypothetical protein FVE67_06065 [Thermosulfurimonas marina]
MFSFFVTGQKGTLLSFTPLKIIVPCDACHNPHLVQKHLRRSGSTAPGTIDTSQSALSLPSNHGNLFVSTISNTTSNYQAPYWFGSTSSYEPDGSTGDQASKTTDYPTFCTDCHNTQNTIYSTSLGRNLRQIDWSNEKHGFGAADEILSLRGPYSNATDNKVLSCLDCHEPHGSPNVTLLRPAVNGEEISPEITATALEALPSSGGYCSPISSTNGNKDLGLLCMRCHTGDNGGNAWSEIHHFPDTNYPRQSCGNCHYSGNPINCSCCHFHGSVDPFNSTRRTF